jgi:hypothetical protein
LREARQTSVSQLLVFNSISLKTFFDILVYTRFEQSREKSYLYAEKNGGTAMNNKERNLFRLGHIRDCIVKVEYLSGILHKKQIEDIIDNLEGN